MRKLRHLDCSLPWCKVTVGQHSAIKNKSAQVCSAHRKIKKYEVDEWKLKQGCANSDGHYGFTCKCSGNTITYAGSLDINHIDGNNDNRDPTNIEVLCKMCHSEVTFNEQHHLSAPKIERHELIDPEAAGLFTGLMDYKHVVKKGKSNKTGKFTVDF